MRIISKFQDYYDCGVAYGIDEKIHFDRVTEPYRNEPMSRHFRRESTVIFSEGYIYFCGKLYNYKLRQTSKTGKPILQHLFNRENSIYKYYYTSEQYLEDYSDSDEQIRVSNRKSWRPKMLSTEFFVVKEIKDDIFIKRGVPYFNYFTNLPILKEYQFSRAVDPMVAFQEISMYLGRLNHVEPECEIGDKYRMKGHGMDCMSFRKSGKKTKECK